MKKLIAALAVALTALGVAATPAAAGNGSSNFYLTGSCTASNIGWAKLSVTNYDNGANQTYHTAVTKSTSPTPYSTEVYLDGVYKGSGEMFLFGSGHGRHTLTLEMRVYVYTQSRFRSCTITL